ncbi:MAG: DUF4157 domain-containing protein [Oscillospiraceae bacterium]|nr:DUF4157 domain-containing protein [Oscillospiraceae bacterium]
MNKVYDKRRSPSVRDAVRQTQTSSVSEELGKGVLNSAAVSAMGYRDAAGSADLKSAMDARVSSMIGRASGRGDTGLGPDYDNKRAEAEADRIGNRFSGASGVEELKSRMGAALGADFSGVRFHTGTDAAEKAKSAGADAFTTGRDIYLGGSFDAATAAHEMVHTVQQGAVQADAPVMSAPAGAVQYKNHNPFKKLYKHTVQAHHDAIDELNNNRADYDKMSTGQRFLWTMKNPLARMRASKNTWDTVKRNAARQTENNRANNMSSMWTADDLGDADPNYQAGSAGEVGTEVEGGKLRKGVETGADVVDTINGDLGTETGLSVTGTPFEAAGIADSVAKIGEYKKALQKGVSLGVDDLDGLKGMDAANGVAAGVGVISDSASLVGNALSADKNRRQGNHWAAAGDSLNAIADIAAIGGDVLGGIPVSVCGVIGSGLSGTSNAIKTGVSVGSAIGNGVTQRKMRKRKEGYAQQVADLKGKTNRTADEDKKLKNLVSRERTMEQARAAARVRKNEDIVSATSSGIKTAANFTAMGLGTAALVASCGVLDPVSGLVNAGGSALSAVTEGIGNRVTKHQRRQLRRDTVEAELGLEEKIAALKSGDPRYLEASGMTKESAAKLSDSDAKHMILKSMGFKSGKRKEAFNQITRRRAEMLAAGANAGSEEDRGILEDMFLGKGEDGKYSAAAVAEKLGLEDFEAENDKPFAEKARANQQSIAAKEAKAKDKAAAKALRQQVREQEKADKLKQKEQKAKDKAAAKALRQQAKEAAKKKKATSSGH